MKKVNKVNPKRFLAAAKSIDNKINKGINQNLYSCVELAFISGLEFSCSPEIVAFWKLYSLGIEVDKNGKPVADMGYECDGKVNFSFAGAHLSKINNWCDFNAANNHRVIALLFAYWFYGGK